MFESESYSSIGDFLFDKSQTSNSLLGFKLVFSLYDTHTMCLRVNVCRKNMRRINAKEVLLETNEDTGPLWVNILPMRGIPGQVHSSNMLFGTQKSDSNENDVTVTTFGRHFPVNCDLLMVEVPKPVTFEDPFGSLHAITMQPTLSPSPPTTPEPPKSINLVKKESLRVKANPNTPTPKNESQNSNHMLDQKTTPITTTPLLNDAVGTTTATTTPLVAASTPQQEANPITPLLKIDTPIPTTPQPDVMKDKKPKAKKRKKTADSNDDDFDFDLDDLKVDFDFFDDDKKKKKKSKEKKTTKTQEAPLKTTSPVVSTTPLPTTPSIHSNPTTPSTTVQSQQPQTSQPVTFKHQQQQPTLILQDDFDYESAVKRNQQIMEQRMESRRRNRELLYKLSLEDNNIEQSSSSANEKNNQDLLHAPIVSHQTLTDQQHETRVSIQSFTPIQSTLIPFKPTTTRPRSTPQYTPQLPTCTSDMNHSQSSNHEHSTPSKKRCVRPTTPHKHTNSTLNHHQPNHKHLQSNQTFLCDLKFTGDVLTFGRFVTSKVFSRAAEWSKREAPVNNQSELKMVPFLMSGFWQHLESSSNDRLYPSQASNSCIPLISISNSTWDILHDFVRTNCFTSTKYESFIHKNDISRVLSSVCKLIKDKKAPGAVNYYPLSLTNKHNNTTMITPLETPNIRVGYGDQWIDMECKATKWWQELLLEPYATPKKIHYLVLSFRDVRFDRDFFNHLVIDYFSQLSSTFEALKLGSLQPLHHHAHKNGIVFFDVNYMNQIWTHDRDSIISEFNRQIASFMNHELQEWISTVASNQSSIVIYVMDPHHSSVDLNHVDLQRDDYCSYHHLFDLFDAFKNHPQIRVQFINPSQIRFDSIRSHSLKELAFCTFNLIRQSDSKWSTCPHVSGQSLYSPHSRIVPQSTCEQISCMDDHHRSSSSSSTTNTTNTINNRHRHVTLHVTYSIIYLQSSQVLSDHSQDSHCTNLCNCPMILNALISDDGGELCEMFTMTSHDYIKKQGTGKVLDWIISQLHLHACEIMTHAHKRVLLYWEYVVVRSQGTLRDEERDAWNKIIKNFYDSHSIRGLMVVMGLEFENVELQVIRDGFDASDLDNMDAFVYSVQHQMNDDINLSQAFLISRMDQSGDYKILEMVMYMCTKNVKREDYPKLLIKWLRQYYHLGWLRLDANEGIRKSHVPPHVQMLRDLTFLCKNFVYDKHVEWKEHYMC
ncbi:hypothetical protein AKO1_003177 [Acrasis kona]|uniref:Mediator of RNA polymerase II transcription subunit 13 n=1 Tax=Acrasis kona TaxID=1008807 RepID=A0AAW2ZA97_9EUKA